MSSLVGVQHPRKKCTTKKKMKKKKKKKKKKEMKNACVGKAVKACARAQMDKDGA